MLEQTIDTLSKGFRRRVGLAQAIVHDPPVLILDEPTDGLDPNQKHEVRALINDMARDKIIVISTHILEEVDAVCSRAIIIARGRIVADDTPAGLAARSRYHNAVTMQLEQPEQLQTRARRGGRAAGGGARRGERARCAPHRAAALGRDHPAGGVGAGGAHRAAAQGAASGVGATRRSVPHHYRLRTDGQMRNVGIIMRRELASYFATPLAYVFILIFLMLANAFTFYLGGFYERGQADLDPFFTFHPWLYLFLIPAISMKLWAEERKSGSIELLMTQPVTPVGGGARQVPRRAGSSPRWRWRSPSRCGSRSTTSATRTTARSWPPTSAACCWRAASSPSARACRR